MIQELKLIYSIMVKTNLVVIEKKIQYFLEFKNKKWDGLFTKENKSIERISDNIF